MFRWLNHIWRISLRFFWPVIHFSFCLYLYIESLLFYFDVRRLTCENEFYLIKQRATLHFQFTMQNRMAAFALAILVFYLRGFVFVIGRIAFLSLNCLTHQDLDRGKKVKVSLQIAWKQSALLPSVCECQRDRANTTGGNTFRCACVSLPLLINRGDEDAGKIRVWGIFYFWVAGVRHYSCDCSCSSAVSKSSKLHNLF